METTNLNLVPANEVELRLIVLNMAMQIVQNGNIDKTPDVIKSATTLFDFATNGGVLPVESPSNILSALTPLVGILSASLAESKATCNGNCHKEVAVPEEEVITKTTKTK